MGTTSLGFPYPDSTDEPNVPVDVQALANAVDAYLAAKYADSGWIDLVSIASGWTIAVAAQVRQIGNLVVFRGNLTNAAYTGGAFTEVAQLPVGIDPPTVVSPVFDLTGAQSVGNRAISINGSGSIQIYASAASVAQYHIDVCRYLTD